MTGFKGKRSAKFRGSQTHGSGAKKKRRGAGNRGGRGRAGRGKKGDGRLPSFWDSKLGKRGFKPANRYTAKVINLLWLDSGAETLVIEGKASKSGKTVVVNLRDLGYDKLLSKGSVSRPFQITVNSASAKAIEKVKAAGGSVTVLKQEDSKEEASEE